MQHDFAFLEEDEEIATWGPAYQPKVFVVMRVSPNLGGTYSEIRKSINGVKRLLTEWAFLGIDMKNVRVYPLQKEWVPIHKSRVKQRER